MATPGDLGRRWVCGGRIASVCGSVVPIISSICRPVVSVLVGRGVCTIRRRVWTAFIVVIGTAEIVGGVREGVWSVVYGVVK